MHLPARPRQPAHRRWSWCLAAIAMWGSTPVHAQRAPEAAGSLRANQVDALVDGTAKPVELTWPLAATAHLHACVDDEGDSGFASVRTFQPVTVVEGGAFGISLPPQSAVPCDKDASISFEARLASGDPLPDWLGFDGVTGRFQGTPRRGVHRVDLIVIAHATRGSEAFMGVTLLVR